MRLVIKYLLIPLFLFNCLKSECQDRITDSLLNIGINGVNNEAKIDGLNKVSFYLIGTGNFKKADSILENILKPIVLQNNKQANLYYLFNRGYYCEMKGDYPKALQYYFQSLQQAEPLENYNIIANVNNNIGVIYYSQHEFKKALSYYFKAVNAAKNLKNGSRKQASYLNNIGNIYFEEKRYSEALVYYTRSLTIRKENNDPVGIANSLNNIGNIHLQMNENDKALACFEEAMEIQKQNNDKFNLAYAYLNKGVVYTRKKNYLQAEKNILEGLSEAKEINFPDALRDAYSVLSDLYTEKGDGLKALKYYKLFISYRDSLINEQQLQQINRQELNNEFFKKEVLLKAENEKQKILHLEEEKRSKLLLYSAITVLILIVAFSIGIYNRYKLTQTQKRTIEEKTHEIIDSINYARRIQTAILVPEADLKTHFSDLFVLFKPRDIVSGDFYWFSESETNKIIAVADCTGHGVPGGFMSMLGYESLQDVVLRENIVTTGEALKLLDKKITASLNKSSKSFRDGMDICLCAFDKNSNTLQFSGANRPLIQISGGVLTEHKPDKNNIGGNIDDDSEKNFTTKRIEYKPGDVFFLFSDGYADQFGGEKGKKFKYKNLQETFSNISNLPCNEQKEKLNSIFENWKGALDQLDDVCVIGIRV